MSRRFSTRNLVLISLLSAVLFALQIIAAPLPNIELVSALVLLYALNFPRITPYVIYVFVLLEGLVYGFHLWWVCYLYVWLVPYLLARLLRRNDSPLFWALVSAAFGLSFGALCSMPYLFVGGPVAALAYFIAGIPFDITHCIGNFVLTLLLYRPLGRLFSRFGEEHPSI